RAGNGADHHQRQYQTDRGAHHCSLAGRSGSQLPLGWKQVGRPSSGQDQRVHLDYGRLTMAQVFEPRKPVTTQTAFVDVENNLALGVHTFTLVVVDTDGKKSDPARAQITVRKPLII